LTNDKSHLSRAERIEAALISGLAPLEFELIDESALHVGHAGASAAGETHYRARVVSERFAGVNRVARQRLVYDLLRAEFASGLHALSLDLKPPSDSEPS
jgi:BolA protein